jgi:hypothetical protein
MLTIRMFIGISHEADAVDETAIRIPDIVHAAAITVASRPGRGRRTRKDDSWQFGRT